MRFACVRGRRYVKLAMIFSVLALICGISGAAAEEKPKEEKVYRATVDADGVQRVQVLGGKFFFDPNHIIVKVNVPVELQVRKESSFIPHNIVIKAPEAGIDVNVSLGEEQKTISFTPTKTGVYPFYCDKKLLFFKSHREEGMEGILEVVE
jgi:plastocyanin domain-containing protein